MELVYIQSGDHIYYSCGTHDHHGIYCGEISYKDRVYKDVVIHFEGKFKRGQIRGISYEKFSKGREIYVVQYKADYCYTADTVIRRAINKLGEPDYNLFGNNCEHFAHWCKTGKKISGQVNEAIGAVGEMLGGAILGGLVGGLAVAFLPLAIPEAAIVGVAIAAGCAGGKLGKIITKQCTDSPSYDV